MAVEMLEHTVKICLTHFSHSKTVFRLQNMKLLYPRLLKSKDSFFNQTRCKINYSSVLNFDTTAQAFSVVRGSDFWMRHIYNSSY